VGGSWDDDGDIYDEKSYLFYFADERLAYFCSRPVPYRKGWPSPKEPTRFLENLLLPSRTFLTPVQPFPIISRGGIRSFLAPLFAARVLHFPNRIRAPRLQDGSPQS